MKFFSLSTILGLTFGILLAGYAVFAFAPPTATSPGGNVAAPLNVGSDPQVKAGGLAVGSLLVDGGVQVGGSISASGNFCLTGGKCLGELFDRIDTLEGSVIGVDTDGDSVPDAVDCAPSDINKWQNLGCYIDNDGDGVRSSYTTTVCSGGSCAGSTGSPGNDCSGGDGSRWTIRTCYVDNDGDTFTVDGALSLCKGSSCNSPSGHRATQTSTDCDDSCPTCYPGSTEFTRTPDSKDQNCDGTVDENTAQPTKLCQASSATGGNSRYSDWVRAPGVESACSSYCGGIGGTYQSELYVSGSYVPPYTGSCVTNVSCGGTFGTACWSSFSFNTCQVSGGHTGWNYNPVCRYETSDRLTCTCTPMYQ